MKVKEEVNEQRERPDYAHTQQEAPRRSRSAASEDHDSSSRQGAPSWRHDETVRCGSHDGAGDSSCIVSFCSGIRCLYSACLQMDGLINKHEDLYEGRNSQKANPSRRSLLHKSSAAPPASPWPGGGAPLPNLFSWNRLPIWPVGCLWYKAVIHVIPPSSSSHKH